MKSIMNKTLLSLAVITMSSVAGHAQGDKCPGCDNQPLKNNITVAATLGYNNYLNTTPQDGTLGLFSNQAPSVRWSDKKLMVGAELGWFMTPNWKWTLGGGFNFSNNPGYTSVPGTWDEESVLGDGSIPSYRAVADGYSLNWQAYLGIDRYRFLKKVPNLAWYGGLRAGVVYALSEEKYNEELAMGKSTAQAWALRGAFVMGAEYFLTKVIFVGAQVSVFDYAYAVATDVPQVGLKNYSADNHTFSFLAAPTVKVGFVFGKHKKCMRPAPAPEPVPEPVVEPAPAPVPEPEPAPVVEEKPLPLAYVFFDRNKSEIRFEEDAKLRELSQTAPDAVIYIVTGYADKGTGNAEINMRLSKQRAERVAKALTKEYGIPAENIRVEALGDTCQPFAENDKNRVVIVTLEKK